MRLVALIGILLVSAWAADSTRSVNDLVVLVRTAIGNRQSDANLSKALRKYRLRESLDQRTIEELEGEGAGPLSVVELGRLRRLTANLPKPATAPAFADRPAPTPEEQGSILEAARELALDYMRSLPDFVCTEVMRRFEEPKGKLIDTLELQVSYSGKRENYKLLTINGRKTFRPFDSVGGVITQGEFGSLLTEVFDPKTETEFHWDHATTLRKRPADVYTFQVRPSKSRYRMAAVGRMEKHTATVGQHGLVYIDSVTRRTLRIIAEADSIPPDFPVLSSATSLDYDFVDIAGRAFLVPLRAGSHMISVDRNTRNQVEFHSYRKFGADTSITYDPR